VLFSSAAEAAATGTKAYIESSRFTGVSLVGTNDRSNSYAKTGGVEASSICSLSASGTSVCGTNDTSLRISSACEGVTWLAVVLGISTGDRTEPITDGLTRARKLYNSTTMAGDLQNDLGDLFNAIQTQQYSS